MKTKPYILFSHKENRLEIWANPDVLCPIIAHWSDFIDNMTVDTDATLSDLQAFRSALIDALGRVDQAVKEEEHIAKQWEG